MPDGLLDIPNPFEQILKELEVLEWEREALLILHALDVHLRELKRRDDEIQQAKDGLLEVVIPILLSQSLSNESDKSRDEWVAAKDDMSSRMTSIERLLLTHRLELSIVTAQIENLSRDAKTSADAYSASSGCTIRDLQEKFSELQAEIENSNRKHRSIEACINLQHFRRRCMRLSQTTSPNVLNGIPQASKLPTTNLSETAKDHSFKLGIKSEGQSALRNVPSLLD
ncbi:hypothetical protein F5Y18DRAFT_217933 [Xylariaceae sp. FL1019]|nr:hypothetical protein F5Y18DRAFT_217933 [Xylariaceae sp. FL1019]